MKRYLLDSHTLIWYFEGAENLSNEVCGLIEDEDNRLFVSIGSFWEMTIKSSIGKLNLPQPIDSIMQKTEEAGVLISPVSSADLMELKKLSFHHNDPFDRLIIAQAIALKADILSRDKVFKKYPVKVIW